MESKQNIPNFSKLRSDVLRYSLDFLEFYEVLNLHVIKNNMLQNVLKKKKLSESFLQSLKEMKQEKRKPLKYDYPPNCVNRQTNKSKIHSKISHFCLNCSNFVCDHCIKGVIDKKAGSNIQQYFCKDKRNHKGSLRNIDYACLSCNEALCAKCIGNNKVGKLLLVTKLKEFCANKEAEEIKNLRDCASVYIKLLNDFGNLVKKSTTEIRSKYEDHLKEKNDFAEKAMEDIKKSLKESIKNKLEKVFVLIFLKHYEKFKLKSIEPHEQKYYEDVIKNNFQFCVRREIFGNNTFASDCQICLENKTYTIFKCQGCKSTHLEFLNDWNGRPRSGDPGTFEYKCLHCLSQFIVYEK